MRRKPINATRERKIIWQFYRLQTLPYHITWGTQLLVTTAAYQINCTPDKHTVDIADIHTPNSILEDT